ncbi:kinase-like domain-containing protein, partial [Entophlyctis helioformis]
MTEWVQGHPNIAECFVSRDLSSEGNGIMLIEELLHHDHAMLCSHDASLALQHVVAFVVHGLAALEHLASLHVVHCDISPNNIMYSRSRQVWCLMDFGGAVHIPEPHTAIYRDRLFGTDSFIAPEAITDHVYSIASDLWSFGATVLHVARDVLSGTRYADDRTDAQKAVAAEIRAEIRRLMRDQPGDRAAASDVRQAFVKIQRDVDRLVNPELAAQVEPMDESQASAVA